MKKILLITVLALAFTSCSKSDKDFIGKYDTMYSSKIQLANSLSLFSFGRTSKSEITAKVYYDLSDIKLNLFIDESDKKLKGELKVIAKRSENTFAPVVKTESVDFDVTKLRINNDTLEFSLENELLKLSSKRIQGRLIRAGEQTYLGFEKGLTGFNANTEKNPLYAETRGDIIYYRAITPDRKPSDILKQFYQDQLSELKGKIDTMKDNKEKKVTQNSIDELEKKLATIEK